MHRLGRWELVCWGALAGVAADWYTIPPWWALAIPPGLVAAASLLRLGHDHLLRSRQARSPDPDRPPDGPGPAPLVPVPGSDRDMTEAEYQDAARLAGLPPMP